MGKFATILALGLGLSAAAQEPTGPLEGPEAPVVPVDTTLDAHLRRQGEAAYEAQQEPGYRTREPARAAGTSREVVSGKGSAVSPDKATRGGGDW